MRQFISCAALMSLMGVGCASAPEQTAEDERTTHVVAVSSAPPSVVDLNEIALEPGQMIVCRNMLKPMSYVIVTHCMTGDEWEEYERQEAKWAQQMVRVMQGFSR